MCGVVYTTDSHSFNNKHTAALPALYRESEQQGQAAVVGDREHLGSDTRAGLPLTGAGSSADSACHQLPTPPLRALVVAEGRWKGSGIVASTRIQEVAEEDFAGRDGFANLQADPRVAVGYCRETLWKRSALSGCLLGLSPRRCGLSPLFTTNKIQMWCAYDNFLSQGTGGHGGLSPNALQHSPPLTSRSSPNEKILYKAAALSRQAENNLKTVIRRHTGLRCDRGAIGFLKELTPGAHGGFRSAALVGSMGWSGWHDRTQKDGSVVYSGAGARSCTRGVVSGSATAARDGWTHAWHEWSVSELRLCSGRDGGTSTVGWGRVAAWHGGRLARRAIGCMARRQAG
ncbi:hypothetical protein Bbelb_031000 [Branchiostoma belcheri]|nr:hypothetical protein Bbelb_031000 [Branchiostoma belcheri]